MNFRNPNLDILKGFLISIVVVGHSIQTTNINFDSNYLFKFIYSFHMPFFFLISGYLAFFSLSNKCDVHSCVINKVRYLVIPFASWYIIAYFLHGHSLVDFTDYLLLLGYGVDRGLWYLWILFIMYGILWIAFKLALENIVRTYVILLFFIAIIPNSDVLGAKYLKWYLIFFLLGILINAYQPFFERIYKKFDNYLVLFLISILFILGVYFIWSRNYIAGGFFSSQYTFMAFKFFIAIIGIYIVYDFITKLSIFKSSFIQSLGKNSLGIYILNFPIVGFLVHDFLINNFLIVAVISVTLSHYLSLYLSKIRYISILFGVKKQ